MNKSADTATNTDKVYQKPVAGQPVTIPVCTSAKTPSIKVRWCNILKPFYYPASPGVARYSITCLLDPNNPEHEKFIKNLIAMENKEGTDTVLKDDICKNEDGEPVKSGLHLIKFQTKDKVKILKIKDSVAQEVSLSEELPYGSDVIITFDVIRYQQRIANQNPKKGLNFKPKSVTIVSVSTPSNTFQNKETEEEMPF